MNENEFWLKVWCVVGTALAVIILIVCLHEYRTTVDMARLGYEEVMVVGNRSPVWQKRGQD